MTPEGKLVDYIRSQVRRLGGTTRKCIWSAVTGAPDLFVMLGGKHAWIECKAPGKKPRPNQVREQKLMRAAGCEVYVVDGKEAANLILEGMA